MTDELMQVYKGLDAKEKAEKQKKIDRCMSVIMGTIKAVLVLAFVLIVLIEIQDIDHPTDAALSDMQGKPRWKMLDQHIDHPTDASSVKSFQRPRSGPGYSPDYTAEIEKYVINRCYRKLVKRTRPDLPAPDFRQIEIIKSAMWRDVEKTTKQILPRVRGKPYKERMTVYESAMGRCRLPAHVARY